MLSSSARFYRDLVLLAMLAIWFCWFLGRRIRTALQRRRQSRERIYRDGMICIRCGYNMRDTSNRCPECGYQPKED